MSQIVADPATPAAPLSAIPAIAITGYTLMPDVADYTIGNLVADVIALLDTLRVDKVRLVAHDWGAVIAWQLLLAHPGRVERYVAMSVGHPAAYAQGGWPQTLKGYYVLLMQLRGVAEGLCRCGNWLMFRLMTRYPEEFPHWHAQLARAGRLTAGMNYYRANFHRLLCGRDPRRTAVPVYAMWSSGDPQEAAIEPPAFQVRLELLLHARGQGLALLGQVRDKCRVMPLHQPVEPGALRNPG